MSKQAWRLLLLCAWTGWAMLATAAESTRAPVHQSIKVHIEPARLELTAEARITVRAGGAAELALADRFKVEHIAANGKALGAPARREAGLQVWSLPTAPRARRIELRWRGKLEPLDAALTHRQTLEHAAPVAGARGAFLPADSAWYPQVRSSGTPQLMSYDLSLDLPAAQRGLVPGRLRREDTHAGRYRAHFSFPFPAEGIDLLAGPYRVEERQIRSRDNRTVRLRTYFHPEIAELAAGYLDAIQGYVDLYEGWIGAYPYTEFSVVSSPTPTGFGMPTLTYLGIDVLKLPFIKTTSLGHEILHNWWGNGVHPDYAHGNWSEGLTTFMADYAYKERESEAGAREMRLAWLRNLAAIPPGQDRPLAEFKFTERTHGTSEIVGYDKAALLFLMLRDSLGHETFDRALRRFWRDHRFGVANWDDLRRAFEAEAGRDLQPFFAQWLTRSGVPALRLASAERIGRGDDGDHGAVVVTLEQDEPAYALDVPLAIRTGRGEIIRTVHMEGTREQIEIEVDATPLAVALDPDLRIARRLAPKEAPPILRQAMIDPKTEVVLLGDAAVVEAGRQLAARLLDHAPRQRAPERTPDDTALLVLGTHTEVDAWLARHGLPARPISLGGKGSAQVWTAQTAAGAVLAVVSARDAEALTALRRPLPHYGQQSWLVFDGAKANERGVWEAVPQRVKIRAAHNP